jgi:very-short-patch-repair endonuclease
MSEKIYLFIAPPLEKGGWGDLKTLGVDMLSYNKSLKQIAGNLRRNMTDAEMLLWSKLRGKQFKGLQFYRQKIIGNYIADFYCPKSKLVIEVDGGQHYATEGREKDMRRDEYMTRAGITVLRFSDREVLGQLDAVLEEIWRWL